jgi:hypothetical protein
MNSPTDIWKLGVDCNKDITIRTAIDYFNNAFVSKPLVNGWRPPMIRVQGKSKRIRDFVSWMNSAPVVSEKAKNALEPLIGKHCEFLPLIELRGAPFYAINVLTTLDCLDRAASRILYAKDDPMHIIQISTYIFRADVIPINVPIFKIPDDNFGAVFVQKAFVDTVIANGLRGASFHDPALNPFVKIARGESLNVVSGLPQ